MPGIDSPAAKYALLLENLRAMKKVLVAFSGGLDSALLLHAAHQALPEGLLVVTFSLPYSPGVEVAEAQAMAKAMGVEHRLLKMEIPDVVRDNPPDRCYHCKRLLFEGLFEIARAEGIAHVLDGTNVDDLADYRPGRRALEELGVESPLLDAGMDKRDIRELSRRYGLSTWNKPSGACLLTRIPHDTRVEEAELRRIDDGENFLRSIGFAAVRLRSHGDLARLEVPAEFFPDMINADREHIVARLGALGYRHVTLDLAGYRMGSLNKKAE
ncbi:MAG: ATP-dependent sacrificial sulfur transferase LarE [Desulfovibrio sp.]|uniref:ATP-dependent sacrificial sulfur transferase LarE n=1 Tax=Desulfovibrio sp. 7SRBS1 TaxID=3378064 RepID=UPI003B3C665D